MYKHILCALVALAFVLSSCADSSSPTSSAPTRPNASDKAATTYKYDAAGWIYNPCCNEYIYVTVTVHLVYKNGVYHYNYSNLSGTDASGNTYHGGAGYSSTWNYDPGANTATSTYHVVMNSPTGCSFKIKYTFHYTVNANGDLVVNNYTYEIECDD